MSQYIDLRKTYHNVAHYYEKQTGKSHLQIYKYGYRQDLQEQMRLYIA